jgi:hypothetical protein
MFSLGLSFLAVVAVIADEFHSIGSPQGLTGSPPHANFKFEGLAAQFTNKASDGIVARTASLRIAETN